MTDTALNTEVTHTHKKNRHKFSKSKVHWEVGLSFIRHLLRANYMPTTVLSLGDTNMYKYSNCSQRTSGLFGRDREGSKTNKPHNKATYML